MTRLCALVLLALAAPAGAQTYAGVSVGFTGGTSDISAWLDVRAERPVGPPVALGTPLRAGARLAYVDAASAAVIVAEATLSAHPLAAGLLDPYAMPHVGYAFGSSGGSGAAAGVELGVALRPAALNGVGVSLFADLRRGGTTLGSTVSF